MDVRLSTEQMALRDSVALVVDRLAPQTVEAIGDPDRVKRLDSAVAESGWRDLRARGDDTGPLASGVEAALVAEELGRGVADTPFVGPTLAAELRRLAGAKAGTGAETVAFDQRLRGVAVVGAHGGPLVGLDAMGATSALSLVRDRGGYRLIEGAPGPLSPGLDLTRPTAAVDPSARRVDGADGLITDAQLARWKALGLALACADLVGIMRGAVRLAADYAGMRQQFGVAIGSFQAVQHLLADAFVATEGSSSIARFAAWAVDALDATEALESAALAKAYCARSARTVCETAVQVHGGIGNTWECMAHVFLRRALLSIDLLGDDRTSLSTVMEHQGIGGSHGLR